MLDIPIFNETGYDLSPLMLDHIKSESIEHFGERIAAIRVQLDVQRHAYNTKTREVRFAFSPYDYGLSDPTIYTAITPEHTLLVKNLENDGNDLLFSDYEGDEDETTIAMLNDILEIPDTDEHAVLEDFDADYYAIETTEFDSFPAENTELE